MKLAHKLDEITPKFWAAWKAWRQGQGWMVGTDLPSQKASPHLVESFDRLSPDGSEWFRQHTALFLWALEELPDLVPTAAPAPIPAEEASMPRLREEVTRLRMENKDIRTKVASLELEKDQETQKVDLERSQRAKVEKELAKAKQAPKQPKEPPKSVPVVATGDLGTFTVVSVESAPSIPIVAATPAPAKAKKPAAPAKAKAKAKSKSKSKSSWG